MVRNDSNTDLTDTSSPSSQSSSGLPERSLEPPTMGGLARRALSVIRREPSSNNTPSPAPRGDNFLAALGIGEERSDAEGEDNSEAESSTSEGNRPPNLADLILLDEGRCRAPMRSKVASGAKLACICGKPTQECKRHADFRVTSDADRAPPGYYYRAVGVQGTHGLQGPRFSETYVEELRALQDHEMIQAAQTLALDDDEPRAEPDMSPRRVSFGGVTRNTLEGPTPPNTNPVVVDLSRSPNNTPTSLGFGMEDAAGGRWVVPDLPSARGYESTGAFRLT